MDLLQNPFYILTASPRDNRQRIMELADERSLLLDSSACAEARSTLTNPRKRLAAEVAWLPGIGPKLVKELLAILESCPANLLAEDKLLPTARANVLAAAFARLPEYRSEDIVTWVLALAQSFENFDLEKLVMLINEERIVAGFPEITDSSAVETEIQERRGYYRQIIKATLDNLASKELVAAVTATVESATDIGEEYCPVLIADLVDSYEVDAQEFLDKEEENILALVEKLRVAVDADQSDAILAPMVIQLIQVVKNWDFVAQPIQVCAKSRGLDHDASLRVARILRSLAIYMFNEHGKLEFSQQLTNMLQEVFAEVGEVAERTAEDADALDEIAEQRIHLIADAKNRAEEWRREVTFEADVGAVFKDKLRISPEGIDWKGRRWALDSITRVRWGGTRHSINFIPTGTTYSVFWGTNSSHVSIELRRETTYSNFIGCLWKAVGVRLLTEYMEGLRDGKTYRFGTAIMNDSGIELQRSGFFSGGERVFCGWGELSIWNGPGVFCIGKRDDKKLVVGLSYQDEDNIHILEAAIRMFFKRGGNRLSSLLEG